MYSYIQPDARSSTPAPPVATNLSCVHLFTCVHLFVKGELFLGCCYAFQARNQSPILSMYHDTSICKCMQRVA